ncbi:MAG: glutamate racemase [Marinilabiliaceae bacterium]|jgi:glutamate racemase|nr:glutamate racemase [Marinilabiliaceae bacterium]
MSELRNNPIGLFDSGVGGLTVANAIKNLLPSETMIYYGDTAHLPYGDKSAESIIAYSRKITEFLLGNNAKMVLIACNSASASAYNTLREEFGKKVILMDVIGPLASYIASKDYSRVGIIGTKRTVESGAYNEKIMALNSAIDIVSLATPLFVPMIEEGFIFDDISNAIIRTYLSDKKLDGIDSLVLGCTHYPIIKNQISKQFNFEVEVIDSARVVAMELRRILEINGLLSDKKKSADRFYVSDYTPYFEKIARMFFEGELNLEKLNIW